MEYPAVVYIYLADTYWLSEIILRVLWNVVQKNQLSSVQANDDLASE